MAETLKLRYNQALIAALADALQQAYPPLDGKEFTRCVFDSDWEQRELKDRMKHVAVTMKAFLPLKYPRAIELLKKVSPNFSGFEFMFFPAFVEYYGLDQFEVSVSALEHFTQFSSSEFAVRPFIKKYPEKMMRQMSLWAGSNNFHIRRLASEGCRPRLPWAMALPDFKNNPKPVLAVLEILKNDESDYVRRSVANNLNDISKDHPQLVIDVVKSWLGQSNNTDALVKHACRGLLKAGNEEVLALFGFTEANHVELGLFVVDSEVSIGEQLQFEFSLKTTNPELGKLRIEYAVDFLKSNGKQSRKIFKISESNYSTREKQVIKKHSFKLISTRRYYAGTHGISVIVNGREMASQSFQLNGKGH